MKNYLRLLAALWPLGALAAPDQAGVDVQLTLAGPDALEVSYRLPPQCAQVDFLKNGRDGRETRAGWQALDPGCGSAGADRLERGPAQCPALRFRVPAQVRQPGYPAAFPLGQGLYAHLSNYALADSCGPATYRFAAPGVVADGAAVRGHATAASADSAALLLQAPLAWQPGQPLAWFDPRLPSAAVAQIREVAAGTVDYLRLAMPDAVYKAPAVAAVWAEAPGGPTIGGDASDVLRLSLYNWPAAPGPAERRELALLVSHEYSHRFQLRDAADAYPDARLIHEGGGEFLRWMASLHNGWLTPAQAAEDLDRALTDCVLYADGQSWRALSPRVIAGNRLEYRCGLAVYAYALAARQGRTQDGAVARLNAFYRDLRGGAKPDFAQAMECGPATDCHPRWIPALLGNEGPMERQWEALFAATGLATPQPPTQAQRDAMVLRALVQLMKDDCGGRSGTTPMADGVLLDGMKACKTFVRDIDVRSIEGLPVFGHAATGQAMAAACTARHEVLLGLKDGATLAVPCARPYQPRTAFYRADIARVLAALQGR
ncbi:hypothetical protein ACLB1G_25685 [Oxalobacteraceae bacterium A2-2]